MKIGIGIDTGGTFTDAVIYDYSERAVLARGKTPTTRDDLSVCVGKVLDMLPPELVKDARLILLSTTLATNACVENKGGHAKLVLLGTTRDVLEWIEADKKYGFSLDDVLCVDTHSSFDGSFVDEPDWQALVNENRGWFSDAQALAIAEVDAVRNGAVCEKHGQEQLSGLLGVPVIAASDLAGGLNVMERGATALLNARLLPVIREFSGAVKKALRERGIQAPAMTVRSDGSLMPDEMALAHPVQTILSGPAASVFGGRGLTRRDNCLIIDMGGTTTDVSAVRGGVPAMTDTIRIQNWKTQIKGVYIDTFGLGGDSAVRMEEGRVKLGTRRVIPLCVAAERWPSVTSDLRALIDSRRHGAHQLHEFLVPVRKPADLSGYRESEKKLLELLEYGPVMLGDTRIDAYDLDCERLETENIVMRCGFTPTDAMVIKGDFKCGSSKGSELGAEYFLTCLPGRKYSPQAAIALAGEIYGLVEKKLFENILRVLLTDRYPAVREYGVGPQLGRLIEDAWKNRGGSAPDALFDLSFSVPAELVGIGAPIHVFLPEVAAALGARCVIPEDAAVANAVGAAIADVSVRVSVEIAPVYASGGIEAYTVNAAGVRERFETLDRAEEYAEKIAAELAEKEAARRGPIGKPDVSVRSVRREASSKEGSAVDLGAEVIATAVGRIDTGMLKRTEKKA